MPPLTSFEGPNIALNPDEEKRQANSRFFAQAGEWIKKVVFRPVQIGMSTPDGGSRGPLLPTYTLRGVPTTVWMRRAPDAGGRMMVEITGENPHEMDPKEIECWLHEVRYRGRGFSSRLFYQLFWWMLDDYEDYNPLHQKGGYIGPQELHEEPRTPPEPEAATGAKTPAKPEEAADNVFVLDLIRGKPKRSVFGNLRMNGPGVPRRTA